MPSFCLDPRSSSLTCFFAPGLPLKSTGDFLKTPHTTTWYIHSNYGEMWEDKGSSTFSPLTHAFRWEVKHQVFPTAEKWKALVKQLPPRRQSFIPYCSHQPTPFSRIVFTEGMLRFRVPYLNIPQHFWEHLSCIHTEHLYKTAEDSL